MIKENKNRVEYRIMEWNANLKIDLESLLTTAIGLGIWFLLNLEHRVFLANGICIKHYIVTNHFSSMISLSFDDPWIFAHYLWFDGKWIAKLIYDILVIGIEMKHLLMWELHTFEGFSSVWMHPVFPLMFFRNKMWNDLKSHFFGSVNSIFVLSFLIFAFWKMLFWSVWGLVLYKACS